jgi:hypothetical protein
MDYITITIIFAVILFIFAIDWKSLNNTLKEGGWFVILTYVVMGIMIYKFITQGTGVIH